jgi:ferredoxin
MTAIWLLLQHATMTAWAPATLRTLSQGRASSCWHIRMAEEPPRAQKADVQRAAAEAKQLLDEEKQRKIDMLFASPFAIEGATADQSSEALAWVSARDEMVGELDSSALLNLDEEADLWPERLASGTDRATDTDMLWVDELSCVGCTWCADVARSTFRMQNEDHGYGQARVIQQGGDSRDVVDEAIACCPADCIHSCTRDELELLEEHRSAGLIDDLLARFQTRRLMGEGDGGGSFAAPHWKDPIVHQSWRKGDKYIKTRRMQLESPLLHQSGEKSSMSLIGTMPKVNDSPSPVMQDGTVIGSYPTVTSGETEGAGHGAEENKDADGEQDADEEDHPEAPTEFLKAVGDAKAEKLNPWD